MGSDRARWGWVAQGLFDVGHIYLPVLRTVGGSLDDATDAARAMAAADAHDRATWAGLGGRVVGRARVYREWLDERRPPRRPWAFTVISPPATDKAVPR